MNTLPNATLDIRRPSASVAEVWLNRPDVRNAFNDSVVSELTAIFQTLGADPALRVIVLGGRDCYAGGVGLAAVCDVLVASDAAHFCLSESRLGLLPGTISPYVIRAMGEQASRRYRLRCGTRRFRTMRIRIVHAVATHCPS